MENKLDAVIASVPLKPFYRDERTVIYNADCRDVLPCLPRFDLLLTDPPYGIGISKNPVRQAHAVSDWDESPVEDGLLQQAVSACSDSIVWGGNYFRLPPSRRFLVWDKQQPANFSLAQCEMAWCSFDGNAKLFSKSVLSYGKVHPTQKPVQLMQWCLGFAPDAETILDPFAGVCTTIVAAKLEGRYAVGIEISEDYCRKAAERLRQGVLF